MVININSDINNYLGAVADKSNDLCMEYEFAPRMERLAASAPPPSFPYLQGLTAEGSATVSVGMLSIGLAALAQPQQQSNKSKAVVHGTAAGNSASRPHTVTVAAPNNPPPPHLQLTTFQEALAARNVPRRACVSYCWKGQNRPARTTMSTTGKPILAFDAPRPTAARTPRPLPSSPSPPPFPSLSPLAPVTRYSDNYRTPAAPATAGRGINP